MTKKKGLDPQEALDFANLMTKLESIQVESLTTPAEKLVEDLRKDKPIVRMIQKKGRLSAAEKYPRNKGRFHWKARQKKRKMYYLSHERAQRRGKLANLLSTGRDGWWEYVTKGWKNKKTEYTVTKEEWDEVLWPVIEGYVPVFQRYDVTQPVSLGNVMVTESQNPKNVLFDGKEWLMKQQGYIL